MKIKNLTPHAVNIMCGDTVILTLPSEGVARAAQTKAYVGTVECDGQMIPVTRTEYGAVTGLPDPEAGVIYLVSVLTAKASPDRKDLYITDNTVRDEQGRVIGCQALAQV